MGRRARIHFAGALYHVIARGNRGQKIFREDGDYRLYLKFLKEYKDRFGCCLYAYALMPSHVHLLVETGATALSKVMQVLQFRYTRNFNIKYRKWGHLFQSRYKAILCERDSYLLELSAYLHLNPVRAGLVDELQIGLAPVLLGGGTRLFENAGIQSFELEGTEVTEPHGITYHRIRIIK